MQNKLTIFLSLLVFTAVACQFSAQPPTLTPVPPPTANPSLLLDGIWLLEWTIEGEGPDGYLYTGEATLNVNDAYEIDGQIVWTMVRTPFVDEQTKTGLSGVEYVRGTFNPDTFEVDFTGYKREDPNKVIGTDHYKLTLSADGTQLNGRTENYGDWKGLIAGVRKP
ncbi:MAG: hypothetical protein H6635_17200 [Anaerolineales bacterium]|nr:hypothetical protein [Anaerolineales bacterium]MCB9147100.1 hypothetical protein [Anaerolineales bacterium]